MSVPRQPAAVLLLGLFAALGAGASGACSPDQPPDVEPELRALAGTGHELQAVGVTRSARPILSLEPREPTPASRRRLVLVGGLDGDPRGVRAVLHATRAFMQDPEHRAPWDLSVVPCANPEGLERSRPENGAGASPLRGYPPAGGFFDHPQAPESRYLWRWLEHQAPDLVLEVRGGDALRWRSASLKLPRAEPLEEGSLASALQGASHSAFPVSVPAVQVTAPAAAGRELLRTLLRAAAKLPRSPARQERDRRLRREPLEVAALLAGKYPQTPAVTYIPALAWSGALRVATLRRDEALRERVTRALEPYLSGVQPALSGAPDVAKLGGFMIFAELAEQSGDPRAKRLALEGAARYRPADPTAPAALGRYWTDDIYMTCVLLVRAARLSGDLSYYDLAARTLKLYAARLQRPDGLFVHSPEAPHAWGRGNGFAALGLMETLTALPREHPEREGLLRAYRAQMAALARAQGADGSWRQLIDRPESYREVTATAMTLAALARGLRLGWLDRSYARALSRGWDSLNARITADGSLAGVCTGTGAGPTRRYYYDRPAIFGPDDRGGAMCLLAALEVHALRASQHTDNN